MSVNLEPKKAGSIPKGSCIAQTQINHQEQSSQALQVDRRSLVED